MELKKPGEIHPDFLKDAPVILGREIELQMPNGEKRKAQFAIVDADAILASHNEITFNDTEGYPMLNGYNINDRNYKDDPNAQEKVKEVAQNLNPGVMISTSRTPASTPIITKDGYVVSGNNRTMSVKLAIKQFPEKYEQYKKLLTEELFAFGITEKDFSFQNMNKVREFKDLEDKARQIAVSFPPKYEKYTSGTYKGQWGAHRSFPKGVFKTGNNPDDGGYIRGYPRDTKEKTYKEYVRDIRERLYKDELLKKVSGTINHPILVRIDYDFPEYNTTELSKYNKDTKKSERPLDKAIKLGKMLAENEGCKNTIGAIVSQYETFGDFYKNLRDQAKMRNVLVECNIITTQELANYYDATMGFTASGKELLENMLSGMVLDREALIVSNLHGVKWMKRNILLTSLPVLVKNVNLPEGSLRTEFNEAFIFENNLVTSGLDFNNYLGQENIFSEKQDVKAVYVNRLMNQGRNTFKASIEKYNDAISNNLAGEDLFGDKPTTGQIFQKFVIDKIPADELELINKVYGVKQDQDKSKKIKIAKAKADAQKQRLRILEMPSTALVKASSSKPKVQKDEGLTLKVWNVGNPDFRQDPDKPLPDSQPWKIYFINNYGDASRYAREYIAENNLGGSNFQSAIMNNGKQIGHVSYNGKVWEGKSGYESYKKHGAPKLLYSPEAIDIPHEVIKEKKYDKSKSYINIGEFSLLDREDSLPIDYVWVPKKERRKGTGAKMVLEKMQELKSNGINYVEVALTPYGEALFTTLEKQKKVVQVPVKELVSDKHKIKEAKDLGLLVYKLPEIKSAA